MALDSSPSTNGSDDTDVNTEKGRDPDFSWRGVVAWVNLSNDGDYYLNVQAPIVDSFPLFPNTDAAQTALEHVYNEAGGEDA